MTIVTTGDRRIGQKLPRPPEELKQLEKVWQPPPGIIRKITAVNNTFIGTYYIGAAFGFFILAGILALMMRTQLAVPENGLIDNVTYTIRERAKLQRDIQVLTAQGRLSGLVLTSLPFVVGTFMYIYNPSYFGPMVQRRNGQMLLAYGVVSLLIGHFMVRRIVKIQV